MLQRRNARGRLGQEVEALSFVVTINIIQVDRKLLGHRRYAVNALAPRIVYRTLYVTHLGRVQFFLCSGTQVLREDRR